MPDESGSRVYQSSRRVGCSLASDDLYNCTELMEHILGLCAWDSLVRLGNCDYRLREIVQDIIRRRVHFGLGRFLHRSHHARFFELLETTDSAVVGGFVRHFMCLENDIYRRIFPSQLSLLIPNGGSTNSNCSRKWVNFISNCGDYTGDWVDDTSLPYAMNSSKTIFFNRASNNVQISLVLCDDDNILSTLMNAPETSVFNILTSRRIYSFYPSSFAQRINLETTTANLAAHHRDSIKPFRFGLTMYDATTTAYLQLPCDEGCYALTRNVLKMEGISRFRWGGISGEYDRDFEQSMRSLVDPFETLDLEWRIGSRCRNVKCLFFRHGYLA